MWETTTATYRHYHIKMINLFGEIGEEPKPKRKRKVEEINLFNFIQEEVIDADLRWCKDNGILIMESIPPSTTGDFAKCTARKIEDVVSAFASIGIKPKEAISYAKFNRLCVSLGLGYRDGHRGAKKDFEIISDFGGGARIIKFSNQKLGIYCQKDKTFDDRKILDLIYK